MNTRRMHEVGRRSRLHDAPFLSQEEAPETPPVGYLNIGMKHKLEVGIIDTPEYKLVQCLFSPANFPSARYESVGQTRERVMGAMERNSLSLSPSSIERSVRNLEKKAIGKFLIFLMEGNIIRMVVKT